MTLPGVQAQGLFVNQEFSEHGKGADPTGQGTEKSNGTHQNSSAWSTLDNTGPNKAVIISNVQTCCILYAEYCCSDETFGSRVQSLKPTATVWDIQVFLRHSFTAKHKHPLPQKPLRLYKIES